jgi:excinuclease ABC subunit B
MGKADQVVEQIIRPTGLVDPKITVRPTKGQIDDLVGELRKRIANGERALVTTLTKRMAEDLSTYLTDLGFKVHYLHSEVETLERVSILRDLRMGVYDVVVGINLLREGLDLPEVSLVAIMDADKEGFLRSATSLIQTFGRAARHVHGEVIMYADKMTEAMQTAINETNRRRAKQEAYNEAHHISPVSITKAIKDLTDELASAAGVERPASHNAQELAAKMEVKEMERMIAEMEKQMRAAASQLEFERAAMLRDQIYELRAILAESSNLPEWKKQEILVGRVD